MIETKQITSSLTMKWITAYFRKAGLTVTSYRADETGYVLTNTFLMVRVLSHPDLGAYTSFDETWTAAQFQGGKGEATLYSGSGAVDLWDRLDSLESHTMEVTRDLYECPGERKKPGTLYRKLIAGEKAVYLDKRACDMLSPDLGDLEGFLFEHVNYHGGCVRASAFYGHVAYIMPMNPAYKV